MFDQLNELCFRIFCDKKSVDSELLFAVPVKNCIGFELVVLLELCVIGAYCFLVEVVPTF